MRDIQHHLASTLSVELSVGTISRITDAVADAVLEWQRRPLEEFYPVVYLDAIRVKVRVDHRVASRSAHIAVGVDMDGIKHVLGIWVQAEEGASFWAHVCAELANRGIKDVLIVEGAPPARERSARGNATGSPAFPRRSRRPGPRRRSPPAWSTRFRAPGCGSSPTGTAGRSRPLSRPICTAPNQEAAWQALTDFSESDMGVKYPQTVATWERAWERFIPFLDFPPMLRRVISPPLRGRYPLHQHDRDCELPATQGSPMNRGHFPSDEAVIKLLWLAICDTCGQTSPRTRQGERTASIQAQGQGQARRRTDHHRLEQGPGPAHHRLPRPNQPLPVKRLHRKLDRSRSVSSGSPVALSSPGVRRPPTGLIISSGQISP